MSRETLEWLNSNVVTGFADRMVAPWWADDSYMPESGAVGLDVAKELLPTISADPVATLQNGAWVRDIDRQAITTYRRDLGHAVQHMAGADYKVHPYADTLLVPELASKLYSVGVLRNGGLAWAQYLDDEHMIDVQGVQAQLKLTIQTSCDGSKATTISRSTTFVVCDNTLAMATRQARMTGEIGYARHTKYSEDRVARIIAEFTGISEHVDAQEQEILDGLRVDVSDRQIAKFLDELLPASVPDARDSKGNEYHTRTQNNHARARENVYDWLDGGFSEYKNTKFGLKHSVDAMRRWTGARGDFQEVAWNNTLNGKLDTQVTKDMAVLDRVLATV